MDTTKSQPLMFRLLSNEPKAFLVVADSEGNRVRATTMRQIWPGIWETPFALQPGNYRGRYYVGDDSQVIYHGPACPEFLGEERPANVDGMDGIFAISQERQNSNDVILPEQRRTKRRSYAAGGRWWA